jgi:hypothetical protein
MKKLFILLFLSNTLLLTNVNEKPKESFYLIDTVNRLSTGETEQPESELISYETETETETETVKTQAVIDEMFNEFIAPIILIIGGLDISAVVACLTWIIGKKKKDKISNAKVQELEGELARLFTLVEKLLTYIDNQVANTKTFNEGIKSILKEFIELLENYKTKNAEVEKTIVKLEEAFLYVTTHTEEYIANGTAEKITKKLKQKTR